MGSGTLHVVATPIGNLEDLSPRARRVLETADLVVAEDTRRTGRLLEACGISGKLTSCHRFNEAAGLESLLVRLREGQSLALVSDGGTPAVSDPGRRLVEAALDAGVQVVGIAGPSAVTTALSIAGFPCDRFLFAGFLPSRAGDRRKEIARLATQPETIVLFEAPHRLVECVDDLARACVERPVALCREMTKLHEEVVRTTLGGLLEVLRSRESVKGECVLVLGPLAPDAGAAPAPGPDAAESLPPEIREAVSAYARALPLEDDDPRRAMRRVARELGLSRSEVKRRLDQARAAGLQLD